jgi:DNA-binding NtrC family response regulator
MTKAMKTKRVLVVDDEESILDLLSEVLGEEGYQVDGVTSGLDALKKMKKKNFDVMLVDLKLPKMDGMELLRTVRTVEPQLPVIVMSGNVSLQSVIQSIRHGAYDYISKPFNLEEAVAAVKRGWEKKNQETQSQHLSGHSAKRSLTLKF